MALALDAGALAAAVALFGVALVHVYWAAGGVSGLEAAVPASNGQALFKPGHGATLLVAIAVAAICALLLASRGFISSGGLPAAAIRWLIGAAGLVFLARAVGDFRYVGLFKGVTDSRFARLDMAVYSPVCAALGVLAVLIAAFGYA